MEIVKQVIPQSSLFKQQDHTTILLLQLIETLLQFIELFDSESVSSWITYHKCFIDIHSFSYLISTLMFLSSLHDELFGTG